MKQQLLLIALLVFCNLVFASEKLVLEKSWVREAPPMAKTLAGYGLLTNKSNSVVEIALIESSLFRRIEMHITHFHNGMMRMREEKNMSIKPGETVEFEPGGRHFMLIKPKSQLKAGMIVPIRIQLKSGENFHFEMTVRK